MASRAIKFSEKMKLKAAKQELEEVILAYDALAVVVNPSNPVSQLTRRQLEAIFRGKITNWKQLGGHDLKILFYSRETSSGIRILQRKRTEKQELHEQQLFHARHRSHHTICQPDPRRYWLCGSGLASPRVKTLAVSYDDGKHYAAPTLENAIKKTYPIVRPLYYYYNVTKSAGLVTPLRLYPVTPRPRNHYK